MGDEEKRRKQANNHVLAMFKRGESLSAIPPSATWFPPRPIIAKNKEALEIIFSDSKRKIPKLQVVTDDNE